MKSIQTKWVVLFILSHIAVNSVWLIEKFCDNPADSVLPIIPFIAGVFAAVFGIIIIINNIQGA